MTKLVSGKQKVLSPEAAQSVSDRYEFINLPLAEPNLGTADVEGHVLSYDSTAPGKRRWVAAPAQGTAGSQGPQGIQGLQGLQGLQGVAGQNGVDAQGVSGTQGPIGAQGIQGIQGLSGSQGLQGIGSQGLAGSSAGQGTTGAQGIQGIQGLSGSQGLQGIGTQGLAGSSAGQGATGSQGIQGIQGLIGTGSQGTSGTGSQGTSGSQGGSGIQGIQGPAGDGGGGTGTITGTGAAGQVAIWTSSTNITGYTNFTFNNVTGTATATDFNSTSDQRLKKNIKKLYNPISIVEGIDGVYYNWADDRLGKENQVGVLANQVLEVLPEAVTMMENGFYSVSYDKLVPVLIEAIKELSIRIQALEAKNTRE